MKNPTFAHLLTCSPAHLLACSLLVWVICSVQSLTLYATDWPNGALSDCALDPTNLNCTTWVEDFHVTLPGYDACPVWIFAQVRECDAGGPLPIIEFHIQRIYFDTPNNINDPNDPCYALHQAYLSTAGGLAGRIAFVRDLMDRGIEAIATEMFNRRYTADSVAYLIDPTSAGGQRYLARKCENGQQTFRSIQGSCTQAFIYDECDYPETRTSGDEKKGGNNYPLYDPTYTTIPCRYVRYRPCSEDGPCCVEVLKVCKETSFITGEEFTSVTKTLEIVGTSGADCEELPIQGPLPGETTTGCYAACDGETQTSIRMPVEELTSKKQTPVNEEGLDAKQ